MFCRKVFTLACAVAVIGANSLALSPIAGAVANSFSGEDAAGVMRAAAAYGLATALSALALAPSIDRIGQRVALVRALVALVVAMAVAALAPNLWVFGLAQALAGMAAGCALPAIYALSVRIARRGRESETLGMVLVGWTVSLVVGGSVAALVADAVHWRLVFAALSLLAGGVALGLRRSEGWPPRPPRIAAGRPLNALRLPGIVSSLLLVATYMTAFYGLYTYLGPHLTDRLGWSTASAGLAPVAYGLGFGAAAFADRLLDRWGTTPVAPFVFLGLALLYVAMAEAAADGMLVITICVAWGLANHAGVNLIISRLIALDPGQSGALMGLYSTVTYLSVFVGATVYQVLFRWVGFAGCAFASACCLAATVVLAVLQARSPRPWRDHGKGRAAAACSEPPTARVRMGGNRR